MPTNHRAVLKEIRSIPSLIRYLRNEMSWPIDGDDLEEVTFEYTTEELGIDPKNAAKIKKNGIKRLRPLSPNQPWGIFLIEFEPKRLPVVALRRILSQVVLKKRATAKAADRAAWAADDLLFISNYGEGDARQITFAHFSQNEAKHDLPTLRVLGWDNLDTLLHLDEVAEKLTHDLAWPKNAKDVEGWRQQWSAAFTLHHREVVTTSKALAIRLAELARDIRDRIKTILAIESDKGRFTRLMKAFQDSLIHDLDATGFADMYAQTIAYGLLSARITNPRANTVDGFATQLPVTNPFLKELMETFLHVGGRKGKAGDGQGIDFDELGVSEVVELLDEAKIDAVVRDFGDLKPEEDPVTHFYELFLNEFDQAAKKRRGVFYTPRAVVSYIVGSVHELIQTEFGLADGLADTATWGEMVKRHRGLTLPKGLKPTDRFVSVLDPATGTGTFLVEAIEVIHRTLVVKWKKEGHSEERVVDLWNEYVPKHLLPRLHGYELLMAPYAIAHLKIGLKLYETGYRFASTERARIYLTNSLEPASEEKTQIEFERLLPALAHEAQAVNDVKERQRFTVVIGNPPYAGLSSNRGSWIRSILGDYYFLGSEPLGEQNPKWLQDDYVKFVRMSEYLISLSGCGVLGLITNHGYLENPTFRGLRYHWLDTFSRIRLLDLHGNAKKKERSPDGSADENVFDIQQGVAIALCTSTADHPKTVYQASLYGLRSSKYSILATTTAATTPWTQVLPEKPFFFFGLHSGALRDEYAAYAKVTEIMPVHSLGVVTARDHLCINWSKRGMWETVRDFGSMRPEQARTAFDLGPDARDWQVKLAQRDVRESGPSEENLAPILYRPFDTRWTYFTGNSRGFLCMPRREVMSHMLRSGNVGLSTTRSIEVGDFNHVFCSSTISGHHCVSLKEVNYFFPLYLVPDDDVSEGALGLRTKPEPNLSQPFLRLFGAALGLPQKAPYGLPSGVQADDIFHYLYSVLHSTEYRSRYAEFLKSDFARIPMPGDLELFRSLGRMGAELVGLHLMKSPKVDQPITSYSGPQTPEVGRVDWLDGSVGLDVSSGRQGGAGTLGTICFRGVSKAVWDFQIGSYQVCQRWLKDRKGRKLSKHDIEHYQKIVVVISETIRVMEGIDEVIEEHGGWPGAVQAGALDVTAPLQKVAEERQHPYEGTAAS